MTLPIGTGTLSRDDLVRFLLASPDPVLIVAAERDESIVSANLAACDFFGLDMEALVGKPFDAVLPGAVARSVAIDAEALRGFDDFVGGYARIVDRLERITFAVVRGVPGRVPELAVFVRSDRTRLSAPSEVEISEQRLRFVLDSAGIGDWDMDLRTNVAFRSPLHDACFGYSDAPSEWGYQTFLAHVLPEDRDVVDTCFREAMAGRGTYEVEFRVRWPDASVHWLLSKGRFYHDALGVPIRIAGIQVDITERKRNEERIRLGALAMECIAEAIVISDARRPDYPVVYVNASFERITGYAAADVIGRNCRILQRDDIAQPELDEVRSALAAGRSTRVTLRNYRKDGALFWNQLTLSPLRDRDGILTHYIGAQADVTSAKALEADLLHRATHDTLTGLPNRRRLEEWLATALDRADEDGTFVAVAFLDLDRFKRVNDSLGHVGGDALLVVVANRLSESIRPTDIAARIGGDEFVIAMSDLTSLDAVELLLGRVEAALARSHLIDDIEISPHASVGVALYPTDAASVVDLIRAADTAMYAAKAERATHRFFDRARMPPATDRIVAENALHRALAHGEFVLDYQPIYDAGGRRIVSLEALIRWHDRARGIVAPAQFIPLAEESGLIVPIGKWVLREICRQQRAWDEAGVPSVPVALNVSLAQLRRRDFSRAFLTIAAEERLDPRRLSLELTESIVMENADLVVDMLAGLRAEGFRISIDDFGTGFSSLNYLKKLSLDTLKIDKSFLDDVAHDRCAAAICEAVVTLAHSVGLTTIAEGVETVAQAEFLRGIGCDGFQGFYFARPGSADETKRLLVASADANAT